MASHGDTQDYAGYSHFDFRGKRIQEEERLRLSEVQPEHWRTVAKSAITISE